ncbi:hypothetical protein LguiB_017708 [Lonicera macranthoides]
MNDWSLGRRNITMNEVQSYCINGGYCRGGDSDMEVDVKEVTVEVMVALKAVVDIEVAVSGGARN